jgi:hypothetical protein
VLAATFGSRVLTTLAFITVLSTTLVGGQGYSNGPGVKRDRWPRSACLDNRRHPR